MFVFMKKSVLLLGVSLLLLAGFYSCTKDNEYSIEDLYGYWQEDAGTGGETHYVRFLTAAQDTVYEDYLYGYEWTLPDQKEENVTAHPHGNNWFRYKLVHKDLTYIHLMTNGGADIPKVYKVTTLTSTKLVYKDENNSYSFSKVNR